MRLLEARPDKPEVVKSMVQRDAGDADTEIGHVGEFRQTHPAGLVDLPEDDLLLRAMNGAPGARMRRSIVRRTPGSRSGWRRRISSKMPIGRRPGAERSSGTISSSKIDARGSGLRRPRCLSLRDGRPGSPDIRYPVAVLNPAFAAAIATTSFCRNFMKSLIW